MKYTYLFYSLIIFTKLCAEECQGSLLKAKEAQDLLTKAQAVYENIQSFSADFSQGSYLDAMGITENSRGTLIFKRPGKMRWNYLEPEEQVFIVNNGSLWLYQVADKQVLVDRLDKMLLSDLPVSFLTGIGNLTKDFKIGSACKFKNGSVNFNLKSNSNHDMQLSEFELMFSTELLPERVIIGDQSNNKNTISIQNYKIGIDLSEQAFEPKFPKDVDINDARNKDE